MHLNLHGEPYQLTYIIIKTITHREDTINPNHFNQNNNQKNPPQFLTGLIPKDLARNLCVRKHIVTQKPIQLDVAN